MREPVEGPDAEEPGGKGGPDQRPVTDVEEQGPITDPDEDTEGDPHEETAGDPDEDDAPTLAAILGAEDEELPPRGPLVPEHPSPEHVLFVVLGVLFGGYVFWRAATVFSP